MTGVSVRGLYNEAFYQGDWTDTACIYCKTAYGKGSKAS